VALYAGELRDDPIRPQPWAGLALALPQLYPGDHLAVLRDRAEVIAHLCKAIQARGGGYGDVVEVVRWLSDLGQPARGPDLRRRTTPKPWPHSV
jgi:hypothetical protein